MRKMYLNSWFALIALDTSKASGSNGRVLKGTSHSIAHCSTCQLKLGKYHKNGKFLHCPQFPNLKLILMTLATTDLSLSSRLSVSYLRDTCIALLLDTGLVTGRNLIAGVQWGFTPWQVNHYITIVNFAWHSLTLGAWCWCCSHIFWPEEGFQQYVWNSMTFSGWNHIWVMLL